jgi:hypothetical protein
VKINRMRARNLLARFMREAEITVHEFIEPPIIDVACIVLAGSDCPLDDVRYDLGFATGLDLRNRLVERPPRKPASSNQSKALTERTGIASKRHMMTLY